MLRGSVLRPVLSNFHQRSDSILLSSILKLADDTKLFATVNNDDDRGIVQRGLSCLVDWCREIVYAL